VPGFGNKRTESSGWLSGEENASVPELEDWGAWLGLHELDLDEQAVLLLGSGPTLDVIGQWIIIIKENKGLENKKKEIKRQIKG